MGSRLLLTAQRRPGDVGAPRVHPASLPAGIPRAPLAVPDATRPDADETLTRQAPRGLDQYYGESPESFAIDWQISRYCG